MAGTSRRVSRAFWPLSRYSRFLLRMDQRWSSPLVFRLIFIQTFLCLSKFFCVHTPGPSLSLLHISSPTLWMTCKVHDKHHILPMSHHSMSTQQAWSGLILMWKRIVLLDPRKCVRALTSVNARVPTINNFSYTVCHAYSS